MSKKNTKVLMTGASGLIGSCFPRSTFYQYSLLTPTHGELDITNNSEVKKYIQKHKPDYLLHLAAFRNATNAEKQRGDKKGTVWQTNVGGTKNLIHAAKENGIFFIHISTDMIFSGQKNKPGPYSENVISKDSEIDLSWYGITKRQAEREILKLYSEKAAIIRIGNVTNSLHLAELDYVGKIFWLFKNKSLYPLFNDQYVTLTFVPDLIEAVDSLIQTKQTGIFHISSVNLLTPYEMAKYIFDKMGYDSDSIVQSSSIENFLENSPNRYPQYGGLLSQITRDKLSLKTRTWQEIVDLLISEYAEEK